MSLWKWCKVILSSIMADMEEGANKPPVPNSWYSYDTWAWLGVVDLIQIFDTLSRLVRVQARLQAMSNGSYLLEANTTTGQT